MWASEAPCSSISKNQKKSFKSGHFYAKILLFRTHYLLNSTTELILCSIFFLLEGDSKKSYNKKLFDNLASHYFQYDNCFSDFALKSNFGPLHVLWQVFFWVESRDLSQADKSNTWVSSFFEWNEWFFFIILQKKNYLALGNLAKLMFWSILIFSLSFLSFSCER